MWCRYPLVALAALLSLGALLGACERKQAELLQLDSVEPADLMPGEELSVHGSGFPAGSDGSLRLQGHVYRPGRSAEPVDLRLDAYALTEQRVLSTVRARMVERLGRGTFHGRLTLAFTAYDGSLDVVGHLEDVALDIPRSRAEVMLLDAHYRPRGQELLKFLGVAVDENADAQRGLVISMVTADSPAESARLLPGDRLVEAGGVVLHSISDLAPAPGERQLRLRVDRDTLSEPATVTVPLAGLTVPQLSRSWTPAAWLLIGLFYFAAFFGPVSSPTLWLARVQSRIRHGEPLLSVGLWDVGPRIRSLGSAQRPRGPRHPARSLGDLAVPVLTACVLFSVALVGPLFNLRFNSLQVYLGIAAFMLWLSVLSGEGAFQARLRRTGKPLGQLLVMMVVVGCACALSGTRSLSGIVDSQGSLPVHWGMFAQPALFVLFPVFIIVESQPPELQLGSGPWGRGVAYAALVFGRLLLCGMGAAIFLGGWSGREWLALGAVEAHAMGAALFVVKTYFLALLLHASRTISLGRQRSPFLLAGLVLLGVALTAAWVVSGAGQQARSFCGFVLSTTAALVTVTAGLRVLLSSAPMRALPRYPLASEGMSPAPRVK